MPHSLLATKGGLCLLLNVHFSIFKVIHILCLDIIKLSFRSKCQTLSFFLYISEGQQPSSRISALVPYYIANNR